MPEAPGAMLQIYNTLTQGAGELNVAGATALAAAHDPRLPVGSYWLMSNVSPWNTFDGQTVSWGQNIIWGQNLAILTDGSR